MAKEAFDSGDYLQCLDIIAAEPPNLQGHGRLATQCCIRLGRLDEAIDRLDALIAESPEDGTLLIERKAVAGQLSLLKAEAANEVDYQHIVMISIIVPLCFIVVIYICSHSCSKLENFKQPWQRTPRST
jgi:hypothetical protein